MLNTVTTRPLACPMGTSVPRVQPNPEGGRPTDPVVLGVEAALEGLVAVVDDRKAMVAGMKHLAHAHAMVRSLEACTATHAIEVRLNHLHDNIGRTIEHLAQRAHRIAAVIAPEIRGMVRQLENELDQRRRFGVPA